MSDLWVTASTDVERETLDRHLTIARVASAAVWPFLAGARDEQDYVNRKALSADRIERIAAAATEGDPALFSAVHAGLLDGLDEDFTVLHADRLATIAIQVSASRAEQQRQAAIRDRITDDTLRTVLAADAKEQNGGHFGCCSDWGDGHKDDSCPCRQQEDGSMSGDGKKAKTAGGLENLGDAKAAPFGADDLCAQCKKDEETGTRTWCEKCDGSEGDDKKTAAITDLDDVALDAELRKTVSSSTSTTPQHSAAAKTAAAPWPLKDNPNFPGEQMPACPKCGGNVVMQGMPLNDRFDPAATILDCKDCGNKTYFPGRTSAKTAGVYCNDHDVWVGDGNSDTHEGCSKEQKATQESKESSRHTAADAPKMLGADCKHCGKRLVKMVTGEWVDPNATGSKTACEANPSGHEPDEKTASRRLPPYTAGENPFATKKPADNADAGAPDAPGDADTATWACPSCQGTDAYTQGGKELQAALDAAEPIQCGTCQQVDASGGQAQQQPAAPAQQSAPGQAPVQASRLPFVGRTAASKKGEQVRADHPGNREMAQCIADNADLRFLDAQGERYDGMNFGDGEHDIDGYEFALTALVEAGHGDKHNPDCPDAGHTASRRRTAMSEEAEEAYDDGFEDGATGAERKTNVGDAEEQDAYDKAYAEGQASGTTAASIRRALRTNDPSLSAREATRLARTAAGLYDPTNNPYLTEGVPDEMADGPTSLPTSADSNPVPTTTRPRQTPNAPQTHTTPRPVTQGFASLTSKDA